MKRILLVEDEMFIRELYVRILTQAGFEVISAIDGEDGLTKALEKPDIILLDIMLPKINGIDVLKTLKEDDKTKEIPVVLMTNLGQESIIKQAFALGAQGYLMKMQLTPYEIVEHVKEYLDNPTKVMDLNNLKLE